VKKRYRKENLYLLGSKPDNRICELFLDTIKRLQEEDG